MTRDAALSFPDHTAVWLAHGRRINPGGTAAAALRI